MTRKLIILFFVLMLCFYSLILSFFGERGIIANNMLKRQLKENEYELDRRNVELENLRLQEQELSTEDGIRSAAMNLGYQVESDDVYVFTTDGGTVLDEKESQDIESKPADKMFVPWSMGKCMLISFCLSFIITFILWIFRKGKGTDDDSQQEEPGDTGDNLNLD